MPMNGDDHRRDGGRLAAPRYYDFGQAINMMASPPSVPSFKGHGYPGPRKTWLPEVRTLVQLDLCSAHGRWLAGHSSLLPARACGPRSRRHQSVVLETHHWGVKATSPAGAHTPSAEPPGS